MPDGLDKWPYLPLKRKHANITIFGCKETVFERAIQSCMNYAEFIKLPPTKNVRNPLF